MAKTRSRAWVHWRLQQSLWAGNNLHQSYHQLQLDKLQNHLVQRSALGGHEVQGLADTLHRSNIFED